MKKSVYLNDETVAAIQARQKRTEENVSGAINTFVARYRAMIRASLATVDLTTREWTTLFGIYAGTLTDHDAEGVAKMLLAEVLDSEEYAAGDTPHLPEKIQAMNFSQRLAAIDMIDRYWSADWSGASGYDEVIQKLKEGA